MHSDGVKFLIGRVMKVVVFSKPRSKLNLVDLAKAWQIYFAVFLSDGVATYPCSELPDSKVVRAKIGVNVWDEIVCSMLYNDV